MPRMLTTEVMDAFEKIALCGNEPASSDVLVNAKCFVQPDLNEVLGKIENLCDQFILLISGSYVKERGCVYYTTRWIKHGDS